MLRTLRLLVPCALVALLWPAALSAQSPAGERRTALLIDAVALDSRNMPVADLKPSDLEVWIGHFRVPIETFTQVTPATDERGGRIVVLVLDDISVPLAMIGHVRDVAKRFVTRMAPGDTMAIMLLSQGEMQSTNDSSKLLRAIDRYNVGAAPVTRLDVLGEQVLKTVTSISRSLSEAGDQRKTIVAIGSGWLLDRPLPPPSAGRELIPEWIEAMKAASRANVNYYVIDPAGLGSTQADSGHSGFARETGGQAFISTNDLLGAADRIMRESANYYLIGVGNPPVGGTGLRELEVKSLRRGVTVRARHAIH
jgi:VWFA-related protein